MDLSGLHLVGLAKLSVKDQASLAGRAARIVREQIGQPEHRADVGRHQRPGGGTRFHDPYWVAPGCRRGQGPGVRTHEVEIAAESLLRQSILQGREIAIHHRLDIGVDRCCREPLVLPHERKHLRGSRDVESRELLRHQGLYLLLVRWVLVGMQQTDRERFDFVPTQQGLDPASDLVEVHRSLHLSRVVHPLVDLDAHGCGKDIPRDHGLRELHAPVIGVIAALLGNIEDVAESPPS